MDISDKTNLCVRKLSQVGINLMVRSRHNGEASPAFINGLFADDKQDVQYACLLSISVATHQVLQSNGSGLSIGCRL